MRKHHATRHFDTLPDRYGAIKRLADVTAGKEKLRLTIGRTKARRHGFWGGRIWKTKTHPRKHYMCETIHLPSATVCGKSRNGVAKWQNMSCILIPRGCCLRAIRVAHILCSGCFVGGGAVGRKCSCDRAGSIYYNIWIFESNILLYCIINLFRIEFIGSFKLFWTLKYWAHTPKILQKILFIYSKVLNKMWYFIFIVRANN